MLKRAKTSGTGDSIGDSTNGECATHSVQVRSYMWCGSGDSFLPSGLFAQTDESQPVVETPIAEQPTLVSTAEISNRADEVNTYLREVETGLDQNLTEIEAIPEQIESLEQQIEGLRPGVTPDVLARMSLRDLESAKNTWVGFEARLDRWRGPLEARSRSLDEQRNTRTVFCVWSTMIVVGNITLEDAR